MHKFLFPAVVFCLSFLWPSTTDAQYYFKDILNTQKLNKEFAALKEANIKFIKISSFEDNDQPSDGFFCEKKVNPDFSQSEMISRSYITEESLLKTDYDKQGRVIKTTTTTPTITNTTTYKYDVEDHLIQLITTTFDDRDSNTITEAHIYEYDKGLPEKMSITKNDVSFLTINFIRDESGNIIEENASDASVNRKFFYYYDNRNRLTDIVRYNPAAKRLLPDYMFEYGEGPLPELMTTIEEGGRNYFIWRYAYNSRQLPEIEKCYSKEKRLLGTIQYDYK